MQTEKFEQNMVSHGYQPPEIIADGNIHRFPLDERKKKDGWYVFFVDGPTPAGVYGDSDH